MKERRDFINSGQRYHFLIFIGIFLVFIFGGVGDCMHCILLAEGVCRVIF